MRVVGSVHSARWVRTTATTWAGPPWRASTAPPPANTRTAAATRIQTLRRTGRSPLEGDGRQGKPRFLQYTSPLCAPQAPRWRRQPARGCGSRVLLMEGLVQEGLHLLLDLGQ